MNSEDLKKYIKERLNNTFIFTFSLSMTFHYWKIILITLSTEMNVLAKIETIETTVIKMDSLICNILYSIGTAILVTTIIILSKRLSVFVNSGLDIFTMNAVSKVKENYDKTNIRQFIYASYLTHKTLIKIDNCLSIITKEENSLNAIYSESKNNMKQNLYDSKNILNSIYQTYIKSDFTILKSTVFDINTKNNNDFQKFEMERKS